MNIVLSSMVILATTVAIYADPQYGFGFGYPPQQYPQYQPYPAYDAAYGYPVQQPNYFRAGLPQSSIENAALTPDARFFGSVTLTLDSTTVTSTITAFTTCTTSTKAVSICSPSGRRRRGITHEGSPKARSLFYDDKEPNLELDSIFIHPPAPAPAPVVEAEPEREARSAQVPLPFVIQPGFSAPENARGARLFVAFGTSTFTTTTTSTYTFALTALCKSTTSFNTCTGSGK